MTTKSTKKPAKKPAKKRSVVKKAAKAITPEIKNGGDKPTVTTTLVAPPLVMEDKPFRGAIISEVPVGAHAETVQAVEQKNEELIAEAKKHPLTFPEICSQSWDEVKGEGDPKFADCVHTHIEKFKSHAEGIINGGSPQAGDTQIARFEQAVGMLKQGER